MGILQKFTKRLYFQHKDNRKYMSKWNEMVKKKRMWGLHIDPDFNRFHFLVWNYLLLHINAKLKDKAIISREELELIVWLVQLNRGVTQQDFRDFPLGMGRLRIAKKVQKFIDCGLLELFEGHGSVHHRGKVYRVTKKCRAWVCDLNMMQLGFKKIPLAPENSSEDFVSKKNGKIGKPDWYREILRFNEWVEENKKEYLIK